MFAIPCCCSLCPDICSGDTPGTIRAVFAGTPIHGSCVPACGNIIGTQDLTSNAGVCTLGACDFGITMISGPCGDFGLTPEFVRWRVILDGSDYYTYIIVGQFSGSCQNYWTWRLNHGSSKPDCSAYSSTNIPFYQDASGGRCDFSGVTCALTSIP